MGQLFSRSPTLGSQPVLVLGSYAISALLFDTAVNWVVNQFNNPWGSRVFLWAGRSAWYAAVLLAKDRPLGRFTLVDLDCGKALTLLRRAAGSNPARSTTQVIGAFFSSRRR